VALPAQRTFLDALLAHGTTSAVVFPTVHAGSVDALFAAAQQRGMRVIAGKVLMDRHAPPDCSPWRSREPSATARRSWRAGTAAAGWPTR
jgi:cytosine/adenosine deaminase-related metal-dependent hydrolase